ncbi:hypothetical protein TWF970_002556 [Orbilia oligospora]|uniref:Uncharacterized protein n=1 Tax=Orbilia oligospora TaxID=2813651 RepID=A0A7C8VQP8_ORBOL|nr:hypothetical protein TWF970_002556 [Orbilia oligospora]
MRKLPGTSSLNLVSDWPVDVSSTPARSMPNSAWLLLCTKRKEFSSSSAGYGSKKEAPAKMCRGVGVYCSLIITECRSQRPPTKSASIDRNFRTMSKSKA